MLGTGEAGDDVMGLIPALVLGTARNVNISL